MFTFPAFTRSLIFEGAIREGVDTPSSSCFPGSAMLMTPDGAKLLGTSRVGDNVLVQSADGVQRFEKVTDFLHKTGTFAQFFVTIEHTFGVMRASANHLILKADGREFVANDARVGDALQTSWGVTTVLAVYESYEKMGMFAPLTSS
eukprot:TRINITY_DN15561_c0_g1_i1.p4 TRINITY_DN15561_c0_g1~~TRINITY_DN15561_c0_g1_i1.p4  ORF type:complete len:147 (+),score=28.83 TRINITY_DN15561_c0_g1_i1:754-1194(+)